MLLQQLPKTSLKRLTQVKRLLKRLRLCRTEGTRLSQCRNEGWHTIRLYLYLNGPSNWRFMMSDGSWFHADGLNWTQQRIVKMLMRSPFVDYPSAQQGSESVYLICSLLLCRLAMQGLSQFTGGSKIFVWGGQVERWRREYRGAEGGGVWA